MTQLLNNILSVLLWRPGHYHPFRHESQIAAVFALATTGVGLWLFGVPALFVVGFAYLIALVTFPCKILMAGDIPPAALATESIFARAVFAGSVSTWPVGAALAAGLPSLLIIAVALHAAFEIWMQVLPLEDVLPLRRPAPAAGVREDAAPEPVLPRFRKAGPPIGTFGGREIPSWLIDEDGTQYDFCGATSDRRSYVAAAGQTVLGTGLIYQIHTAEAADAPDSAPVC